MKLNFIGALCKRYNLSFRSLFLTFLSLCLLYLCWGITQYVQSYNYSTITHSNNNLTISYEYQIAHSVGFSAQDALKNDKAFISTENLSGSFSQKPHWLKYQVKNNSQQAMPLVLHIDGPMLHYLKMYEVMGIANNDSNTVNDERSNSLVQPTLINDILLQDPVFPHHTFTLKQGEEKLFLLETQTLKHAYVPLLLYSQDNFSKNKNLNQVIFIIFISTILIMIFYNMVIYSALKDKVYLVYISYLLGCFLVLSSANGFGYYVFTLPVHLWLNAHTIFFHYGLILCLLFLTLYFFKYEERKNKRYKISLYMAWGYAFIAIVSFLIDRELHGKLFYASMPIFYLWCAVLIIPHVKSDYTWGRFYFFSWIPLLAGAIIQPLVLLNILDYSFFTRHAFLFAVLIEVLFMACALAERMRTYEQNRVKLITYHPGDLIPRKVSLETKLSQLIIQKKTSTHVFVIKPENIDNILLYIDDKAKSFLMNGLYTKLNEVVAERKDVVFFNRNQEKICLLENNCFALLSHTSLKSKELETLTTLIQDTVFSHYILEDFSLNLSAEIGIAKYPEHGSSAEALISHAQLACQHAEKSENKWAFYLNESENKNHDLINLAKDLQLALKNNELELYHQPQVDLKTLRVCGSECLLRWEHKTLGYIFPPVFISIAENIGLMNQLTLWVVKRALEQHTQITENEIFNHMVSINISGKDIESITFFDDVKQIIVESGIAPDKIIFEITESSEIVNNLHAADVIEKLAIMGITISIDDFGTGYSSLSYMNSFPFQELKIDRQFVEGVCEDPKRKVIAESSVKMAKGLGLEVVAEGINSKLDEDTLRQFGCDIGQGYYYARPMPIVDYIEWLSNQVNAQIPESYYGEFIPAE